MKHTIPLLLLIIFSPLIAEESAPDPFAPMLQKADEAIGVPIRLVSASLDEPLRGEGRLYLKVGTTLLRIPFTLIDWPSQDPALAQSPGRIRFHTERIAKHRFQIWHPSVQFDLTRLKDNQVRVIGYREASTTSSVFIDALGILHLVQGSTAFRQVVIGGLEKLNEVGTPFGFLRGLKRADQVTHANFNVGVATSFQPESNVIEWWTRPYWNPEFDFSIQGYMNDTGRFLLPDAYQGEYEQRLRNRFLPPAPAQMDAEATLEWEEGPQTDSISGGRLEIVPKGTLKDAPDAVPQIAAGLKSRFQRRDHWSRSGSFEIEGGNVSALNLLGLSENPILPRTTFALSLTPEGKLKFQALLQSRNFESELPEDACSQWLALAGKWERH